MSRILVAMALSLQCGYLMVGEAFAAPAITYADLSTTGGTTLADPSETVRFYVEGSGCRVPALDSLPTITGSVIEFSLAFSLGCFATPPGFLWTGDLSSIPPGTYTVNYYRHAALSLTPPVTGPNVLASGRTLNVVRRPVAPQSLKPGTPDPSFGNNGVVDIPFPGFFSAPLRLAMLQNGQVLASSVTSPNYAVSRMLDSGAVDGGFAVGGTLSFADSAMQTRAMAVGVNDEILLAGGVYDLSSSQILLAIQRYSAQGNLMNEIRLTQAMLSSVLPIGLNPKALDIVSFPDGRFAVAGLAENLAFRPLCTGQWFVAKFTAGGTLDPTFGRNGVYVGPSAGCVFRLAATRDGGLLGLGTDSDAIDANFLVKLDPSGQRDGTFGQGGIVTGSFARVAPRVQSDNRIVLGGANFSLLRLQSNGAPDPTFGNQGVIANQTGMALQLEDFVLTPNILLVGALVVGHGASGDPTVLTTQPVLVRYSGNGTLDTTFGNGGISMVDNLSRSGPSGANGPAEMMTLMTLPSGKALLAAPSASGGWFNRSMFLYRFAADPAASPIGPVAPGLYVGPDAPTTLDTLYVDAFYSFGGFVNTHSVKRTGNTVEVTLVQDGPDFSPNPPFSHHEPIGMLPVGTYTIVVTLISPTGTLDVRTSSKIVGPASPRTFVQVIEFYNQSLDHYFLSSDTNEIADLDTGKHIGWQRTGESFGALVTATADTAPVCRDYITPAYGDSHFFSAFGDECANVRLDNYVQAIMGRDQRYLPETSQAFYVSLPDLKSGACPGATVPVFRLWNKRTDSNHRYTSSPVTQAAMINKGYIAEGYGPKAVAMCAPTQ